MKKIKKLILVLMSFVLMFSLSGCLNKNIRNLSDSEIIKQIQAKMKEEMDKINFEVNFDDYEFKVNTGVEIQSNFGNVTIKDKRYNYDPITIYDGNFEVLDKEKIGINPIIFVAHGYQDYVDNVLLNDKMRGNNLDEALRISGGKLSEISSWVSLSQTFKGEIGARISVDTTIEKTGKTGDYYILPNSLSSDDYEAFFKDKKSTNISYSDFVETMGYVISIVILTKNKITDEMKKEVEKYQNNKYIVFILRNED